ncbi:MAG: spore coat associated protein CotJA [Traorella sp.]
MSKDCDFTTDFRRRRDTRPLAMAYVRKQSWRRIYKPDVALARGTLFNELDKPFSGVGIGGRHCEKD